MYRPQQLFASALLLSTLILLCTGFWRADGPTTAWSGIRDGTVYVQLETNALETIEVSWLPAWISEHQPETVYVFGPNGSLVSRISIEPHETRGSRPIELSNGEGTYRVVVPGYSFRHYTVDTPDHVKTAFEPAKGHMSLTVRASDTLYTQVPGDGAVFHLAAFNSRNSATVRWGKEAVQVADSEEGLYTDYARLPLLTQGATWGEIEFGRSGKVGFWMDGAPNLFFHSPDQFFEPQWHNGRASLSATDKQVGALPRIGTYFEFFEPGPEQLALAEQVAPKFSNYYIPEDALKGRLERDLPFLRAYSSIGVDRFVSILNDTRRDSLTEDANASQAFLLNYLMHHDSQGLPIWALAFVDEPNLRYTSYEAFADYFDQLSAGVRSLELDGARPLIAAPESSRLVGGPTNKRRASQSGYDWTDRLLNDFWDRVDLVTFHMWMVRDLEATDQYQEEISALSALVEQHADRQKKPPKPLVLTQTNISSGDNLSPYEQETFYAGLWWASVVAQSANTGALSAMNWFKSVDEGVYRKGYMRLGDQGPVLKPIGHVMAALHPWLLPSVLENEIGSAEVDALVTYDIPGALHVLLVNKSRRTYVLDLPQDWSLQNSRILTGDLEDLSGPPPQIEKVIPSGPQVELPPLSIALLEVQQALNKQ